MKVVKESINEIKRDNNRGSMVSIGVGSIYVTHAFDEFFKKYPEDLDFIFTNNTANGPALKYALPWVAKTINTNIDRIGYINANVRLTINQCKFLDNMVDYSVSHSFEKTFEMENRMLHTKLFLSEQNQIARMEMRVEHKDKSESERDRTIFFYIFKMPYALKESLNEIKRGEPGSGLSSVGIGDVTLNKAYKYITQTWPDTYEDDFDLLDNAKHYPDSQVLKYPKIIKEAKILLNTSDDRIIFSMSLKNRLSDMQNWVINYVKKSSDLQNYTIDLTERKYVRLICSQSLGAVVARVYIRKKFTKFPVLLKTFCFVRF